MAETGSSDDPLKISFVVTMRQDPQLYQWLQHHPFKSTSAAVRALLNIGTAAMVALDEAYGGNDQSGNSGLPKKPRKIARSKAVTPPPILVSNKERAPDQPIQQKTHRTASDAAIAPEMKTEPSPQPSSSTNSFIAAPKPEASAFTAPASIPATQGFPLEQNDGELSGQDLEGALQALTAFDRRF